MAESEQQVQQMEAGNQTKEIPKKRNVLIAMDGSKHSKHACEWFAEHMYNKDRDNVIMAYCAEMSPDIPTAALMGSPASIEALTQEHRKNVKEVFTGIDKAASEHNMNHTLERLDEHHHPGEAIVKAAEQQNAGLIIVGSRGVGTIRRTILGSVSDYIIHHAHVPVVVCKHEDEHHRLK